MIMYYLLQLLPFAPSVTQIPRILDANIHITALAVRLVKSVQQERTLPPMFQAVRCQQRLAVDSVMQATFAITLEAGRQYKTIAAVYRCIAQQAHLHHRAEGKETEASSRFRAKVGLKNPP